MNQKLRRNKSVWLMVIVLVASVFLLSIASIIPNKNIDNSINVNGVAKTKDEAMTIANPNKIPDPNFPFEEENENYAMVVPTLKDRLTLSEDKATATLYAPYVDGTADVKDGNWYDQNQQHFTNETIEDSNLHWAYADSNILAWYLSVAQHTKAFDTSQYAINTIKIFQNFYDNWKNQSYDAEKGLNWYFTGKFANNQDPENLKHSHSGKYLITVPNVPYDISMRQIDPAKSPYLYGNFKDKVPFYEDRTDIHDYYHSNDKAHFSKVLTEHLHYGAVILSVKNNDGATTHNLNCWGADYDTKTGDVTRLYVTDSKDTYSGMSTIKIKNDPDGGIQVDGYLTDLKGGKVNDNIYLDIKSSLVLYAPNAVKVKEKIPPKPYEGEQPEIESVTANGEDIIISAKEIQDQTLEYGVSYYKDGITQMLWQDESTFKGLGAGSYYFYVRTKASKQILPGNTSIKILPSNPSTPVQHIVMNDKVSQNMPVFTLGNSGINKYDTATDKYNYVWYGEIDGNPILWRVLDTSGSTYNTQYDGIYLYSENILDHSLFSVVSGRYQNYYDRSTAKNWNEAFLSEGHHFYDQEKNAMLPTSAFDSQYRGEPDPTSGEVIPYGQYGGTNILLEDKLFLPSVKEIQKEEYGFNTKNPKNTAAKYYNQIDTYWTRSSKLIGFTCVGISDKEFGGQITYANANIYNYGMRPAFNLDKTKVLMTSAVGVMSSGVNNWTKMSNVNSQGSKITLIDSGRHFALTNQNTITASAGTNVSISYRDAVTGKDEYISVVIIDSNKNPVYYSKVANSVNATGDITFTLPMDIKNGTYTIKVFNEKENGDMRTNYASDFEEISLIVDGNHTHKWENIKYTWAEDNSSVTATADCVSGDKHSVTMTANTTYVDKDGKRTYTAEFGAPFATQTKVVDIKDEPSKPIPPINPDETPGGDQTDPDNHNKPTDPDINPDTGNGEQTDTDTPSKPDIPTDPEVKPDNKPTEPDIQPNPSEPSDQEQKPSGNETISQDNSLSSGAVAGIAVGSVAGVGAIGVGVFFLVKHLRKRG